MSRFYLWLAGTGEFDQGNHKTMAAAERHKVKQGLDDDWHVVELTENQAANVFSGEHTIVGELEAPKGNGSNARLLADTLRAILEQAQTALTKAGL